MKPYQNEKEIAAVVAGFEKCTTGKDEFTHRSHLTVAVYYLRNSTPDQAFRKMRAGLFRFLDHHGVGTDIDHAGAEHLHEEGDFRALGRHGLDLDKHQVAFDTVGAVAPQRRRSRGDVFRRHRFMQTNSRKKQQQTLDPPIASIALSVR